MATAPGPTKSILFKLPEPLHRALKIKAARDGTTLQQILIDLVGQAVR